MKAIEVHTDRRLGGARLGSLLAIAAAVLALGIGTLARIGPAGESASGLSAGDLDRATVASRRRRNSTCLPTWRSRGGTCLKIEGGRTRANVFSRDP